MTSDFCVQLNDDEPSPFSNNHLKLRFTKANKSTGVNIMLFHYLLRYTLLNLTNYTSILIVIAVILFLTAQETHFASIIELI